MIHGPPVKNLCLTSRFDFTNIFLRLFCTNKIRIFLWWNGLWRTANKFGKKCTNLSLKIGVLFVGEIDQRRIFRVPATFRLSKKIWLNRHQGYISLTFYAKLLHVQIQKEQKRLMTWLYFLQVWPSAHVKAVSKLLVKQIPGCNLMKQL
jgi:hypothetical protein